MGTVVTYAGLVAVGIAYATLVEVGILWVSSVGVSMALIDVVVLTCWLADAVMTYMYSCSWELELWSPVAVYGHFHLTGAGLVCHIVCDIQFACLLPQTHQHSDNDDSCCDEY